MERKIAFLLGLILLIVLSWLVLPTAGDIREPVWVLPQFSLQFDAANALRYTQEFNARFSTRVIGTSSSSESADFIARNLQSWGYRVSNVSFDATIQGHSRIGRNVLGSLQGLNRETITIITHFDTARTATPEPRDNLSAIGVFLELAHVFSGAASGHRSLLFVAVDGAGDGMLGARSLSRHRPVRDQIAAVLCLDGVGIDELRTIVLHTTGMRRGYTPPWLRQISRRAVEDESIFPVASFGLTEQVERSLQFARTSQGPLLEAGIPAISLSAQPEKIPAETGFLKLPQGGVPDPAARALRIYGRTAERIVRTLDWLPQIPQESMGAFCLRDSIYLSPKGTSFLHYLTFTPVLAIFALGLAGARPVWEEGSAFRALREFLAYIGTAVPLISGYATIALFRGFHLIPGYDHYPPPCWDVEFQRPPVALLGAFLAMPLILSAVCYWAFRLASKHLPEPRFHSSKLALVGILTLLGFLALLHNSYWALTVMTIPAWIWASLGTGKTGIRILAQRILILAGAIPAMAVYSAYTAQTGLGWTVVWHNVLALSTGVFSLQGYLLSAMTIALGIRFLAVQSYRL